MTQKKRQINEIISICLYILWKWGGGKKKTASKPHNNLQIQWIHLRLVTMQLNFIKWVSESERERKSMNGIDKVSSSRRRHLQFNGTFSCDCHHHQHIGAIVSVNVTTSLAFQNNNNNKNANDGCVELHHVTLTTFGDIVYAHRLKWISMMEFTPFLPNELV